MTCIRGVFRVSKRELDEFAAGKRRAVNAVAYGTEHGLISTRATAGFHNAAYKTKDGRVWFATVRGAAVIDPTRLAVNSHAPPVHIEDVRIDDRTWDRPGPIEAPPGRGDLAIHYTGLSFLAPEKVKFKVRLEGHDRDWVDVDNRRAAFYSNLPPGRYTFRVIAANNDGVWNRTGAALALVLLPHWYQTWAFRVAAALLALLAGVGLYRNHVRRLKQRQRELERSVAERTAELAAANKELEAFSYSVSHDLRAPLRRIDGFGRALLERHGAGLSVEAQEFLGRMRRASESMDRLIDNMLALARVSRSEMRRSPVDLSALGREIGEELRGRQPERVVELVIAPGLTVKADPNLMRIALENLIGNAWKFTGKHARARIELGASERAGKPVYFVRDDGEGFDPADAHKLFIAFARLHSPADFEGSGVGLATVSRVIERHGGEVWAEGSPGQGATFYFTVPAGQ
jgi:signal transduction histidine kinase